MQSNKKYIIIDPEDGIFLGTAKNEDVNLKINWGETIIINIGIAGGENNKTKIGSMYCYEKIIDDETGNIFLPDILIKHNLEEITLTTVQNSVTNESSKYTGLVDMEASTIFELFSSYITSHRLVFLKIVSDTF